MNSYRIIEAIKLELHNPKEEITERQLQRMNAIVKRFGASITSLEFKGLAISIDSILELLHQAPKLESLTFYRGTVIGSVTDKTTLSLQLPSLKKLDICDCTGLLDIVNLIPAGSLNYYSDFCIDESTKILKNILVKQYNIKSLTLFSYCEPNVLCVNQLQLDALLLGGKLNYNNDELMEILKCHTNLKELRLRLRLTLSESCFKWICENLKKLEVFEVYRLQTNVFKMLGALEKLRHFRTDGWDNLLDNGFNFKSDSLEKLEIFHPTSIHNGSKSFCCGELLNKMVHSMVKNFANLTFLEMRFDDFSALSFVLSQCTTILHIRCFVKDTLTDQLTQQRFPNIQKLELFTSRLSDSTRNKMSQIINFIVRGMPNLKSLTITANMLILNLSMLREFIRLSKSLDFLYVNCFDLDPEVSTYDFVEAIRRLLYQLNGYQLMFTTRSLGVRELNGHTLKDILSNESDVRDVFWDPYCFALYKSGIMKFHQYRSMTMY